MIAQDQGEQNLKNQRPKTDTLNFVLSLPLISIEGTIHPMNAARFPFNSVQNFSIFLAAFLIFLWFRLPPTRHSPYFLDDFCNFQDVKKISSHPLAPFLERTYKQARRHPFFAYLLFLEYKLFGLSLPGYYAVLFLFHFLNCLLLARLMFFLAGDAAAAVSSGLVFLFSSSFYSILIHLSSSAYAVCLFFFLLALGSWLEFIHRRTPFTFLKSALFIAIALLNSETAFVFPFLAFFFTWRLAPKEIRNPALLFHLALLAALVGLISFYLLNDFFHSPDRSMLFSIPALLNIFPKIASLFKMLFQPLFIPEKGLLAFAGAHETPLRFLPLLILMAMFFFLFKNKKTEDILQTFRSPVLRLGVGWILITVLPYLSNPTPFEHATRYMYFPMAGFSLMAGIFIAGFFKTMRVSNSRAGLFCGILILGYILAINLASYSHHFQGYRQLIDENPEENYESRIVALFREQPARLQA